MLYGLEDEVVVLEGLWLILQRYGVVASSLMDCDEVGEVIWYSGVECLMDQRCVQDRSVME